MNADNKIKVTDCSVNFCKLNHMGAGGGGLASMGDALAAATIASQPATMGAGAGMLQGIESISMSEALASSEQASSLLAQCQQQLDARIIDRSANKLRSRMAGDGKTVGDDAFKDSKAFASFAVTLWRACVAVDRGPAGADHLVSIAPESRERHVARVVWRALVQSLSDTGLGDTVEMSAIPANDWTLIAPGGDILGVELVEPADRVAACRAALVDKLATLACGRGRRKESIDRVGNCISLILSGETLDQAARLAGFKSSGHTRAGDSFLRAARRLNLVAPGFTSYIQSIKETDKITHEREDGQWTDAGDYQLGSYIVQPFKPAKALPVQPSPELPRANRLPPGNNCGANCLLAALVRSVNLSGPNAARVAARAYRNAAQAARTGILN